MATVLYKDYRIEIQPFTIAGGWSARVQVWSFRTGTTRVEPLVCPTPVPFPSPAAAQAYAERFVHQWVQQQQEPRNEQTPKPCAALTQEEQRERAATYGEHIEVPTRARAQTAIAAQR